MDNKVQISWDSIKAMAEVKVVSKFGRKVKAYGVPRGGQAISALFNPVDTPEGADIIVDDLIDSGATMEKWQKMYPHKPFIALYDKRTDPVLAGRWLVFPWEKDEAENEPAAHFTRILQYFGQDVGREGLQQTPARFVRYLKDFLTPPPFEFTTFDAEGHDEMIVETDIPFYSLCEHHTLPFFGTVAVGYIPEKRIAGLSKLARAVQFHARGLQNQERMTAQIAASVAKELGTESVAVVTRARHLCMEMRGAKAVGTVTTTSKMLGKFMNNPTCRNEFLSLVR